MILDSASWQGNVFLGGKWSPSSGGVIDVVEPATGNVLGQLGLADPADVAQAAESAAEAQRGWAALPHPQRAAVLRRAGQLFAEHADEVSWWNIREVGAIPPMAGFAVHVAEQECYEAAGLPSRPYGELLPSEEPRLSMARRVPVGVVGVISPFNVPLILSIRSVAPALALGNAVILKPDPRTAVTGGVSIARIFEEAGLPPGVLQMLPGGADAGEAMVTHPLVRVISFTGSTPAGRKVGALAGQHLKRAHLELGGNNALIVLEDADVDQAVTLAAFGSFFHQGQICMTTGRHLVHERVYDDFVERLAAKAAGLPVGDPATSEVALGPMIDAGQRDHTHDIVTSTAAAGAVVAAGGSFEDLFYRATVLTGVPVESRAFAEEIFGPVAPVTRFRSADDIAALARNEYGLSLGIVTKDVMRGLALADKIPTGIVHINDQTISDEANSPFGGVGASGTGSRFGGAAANVDAFTETRWVTMRAEPPGYPF
ncbi:MAG: benzaldehyde dehydrogenase [Cryptosporangiaceae bacterium]|nr:benzaldehyde dehydrogenase [Cryptosporangiaceae bacterium]